MGRCRETQPASSSKAYYFDIHIYINIPYIYWISRLTIALYILFNPTRRRRKKGATEEMPSLSFKLVFVASIRRRRYRAQADNAVIGSQPRVLFPLLILIQRYSPVHQLNLPRSPLNRYFVVFSSRPVRLRTVMRTSGGTSRAPGTAILDAVDIYPIFRLRSVCVPNSSSRGGGLHGRETATDIWRWH